MEVAEMKYAFMTFSTPELTFSEVMETARKFGYDGVEPRIDSGHKHGIERDSSPETRKNIRQLAKDAGIAISCIATSCKYADPAISSEQVDITRQAIDLAADVGCSRLRVFGGQFPETVSREQAKQQLSKSLLAIADHAAERGVIVCVETHDAWCNPNDLADVIQRVDSPSIAVNWDIMHPVRAGGATMDQAFEALKPWIKHVHFHDGNTVDGKNQLCPIGEGIIDHKRAVELLQEMGYEDHLSGEWIKWEPYDVHLPRELATIRSYET